MASKVKPYIITISFDRQGHIVARQNMPPKRKALLGALNKLIARLVQERNSLVEEELSKKSQKELAVIVLFSKASPAVKNIATRILVRSFLPK